MSNSKCELCGKFVTDDNFYTYTNYGSYGDMEPPAPICCCDKCLPNPEYVWIKPQLVCRERQK